MSLQERLFRSVYRIRRTEEEIARVYPTDRIKSPVHLSIGQEAVAAGVCEALAPDDIVFGTYRGHAMYLAKGGDLPRMIAELYGKVEGCARGKGGSMHLVDVEHGVMGTSAVVATTIPNAVGYAYALKLRREPRVVVSFFGDGATEEGVVAESLNFAALKGLPVIFVCENNGYAIHTPQSSRQAVQDICAKVRPYGIPAERIEDNDALAIHARVSDIAARMRAGVSGPVFLECMTYRWLEHVGPNEDYQVGYRDRAEAERWIRNDPLERLGSVLPQPRRLEVEREEDVAIRRAFEFAEAGGFPPAEELFMHVYKQAGAADV